MNRDDLLTTLDAIKASTILVVGDLMLDRYVWGNARRVSQEAPVLVLQADTREDRLGGAANVANMLRGLEAQVQLASVVGTDVPGERVMELLEAARIDTTGVLATASRPTTVKERFIGRASGRHAHQVLRVDSEVTTAVAGKERDVLLEHLVSGIDQADAVVVADYSKGVCSPELVSRLIGLARTRDIPILVDPCLRADYSQYRGATILKANRSEAELATGRAIRDADEACSAAADLCSRLELRACIVTLDGDGMAAVLEDGTSIMSPTRARSIYDITGAGDMAAAMIALCAASRMPMDAALELANVAAGIEVERLGASVVTRAEIRREIAASRAGVRGMLSLDEVAVLAQSYRSRGRSIALANGCFDLLHVGHLTYLQDASGAADVLFVAVNSDAGVRRLKGPGRPVIPEHERAALIEALACVDQVVVFDDDTPHRVIEAIRPDVLVKGGDYLPHEVVGRELVESYGGKIVVTRCVDGASTSRTIRALQSAAVS